MKNLILLSLFLTSIPTFANSPFCVAHRGDSITHFENSMTALVSAAKIGVGGIEFDIFHTKDGVPIISHDETLERIAKNRDEETNCEELTLISELTLNEIQTNCILNNDEDIPTLEDTLSVLAAYPSRIVLEYKDSPQLIDMELLKKYYENMPEKIVFISFDKENLMAISKFKAEFSFLEDSNIILLQKYAYALALKYDGLQAKYINKFQIWLRHILKKQLVGEYTVNDAVKMRKSLEKGVDFITTDYPRVCMKEIEKFRTKRDKEIVIKTVAP